MTRCPTCGSYRIFVVVTPDRRAACLECGADWKRRRLDEEDLDSTPLESSPWIRLSEILASADVSGAVLEDAG
jgi:hypothetical protein